MKDTLKKADTARVGALGTAAAVVIGLVHFCLTKVRQVFRDGWIAQTETLSRPLVLETRK